MNQFKLFVRDWLPPAFVNWMQRLRGKAMRYDGALLSWEIARTRSLGYDNQKILKKVLASTLCVVRGEAVYERDSVCFHSQDYEWFVVAGLLSATLRNEGTLNVLDFGGALGSTFFQHRKVLGQISRLRWNVVEQAHYVQAGQTQFQNGQLFFFESIANCLATTQPNVVILSSVLQYLEDYASLLEEIAKCGATTLIVNRTPLSDLAVDQAVVQRVPPCIYEASYPMWVLSRSKFLGILLSDWRLCASSPCDEGVVATSDGQSFSFEGMLFERRS